MPTHPNQPGILSFIDHLPPSLTKGPWSPSAYIFLTSFGYYLTINLIRAINSYKPDGSVSIFVTGIRLLIGFYCLSLLIGAIKARGYWLLKSYTITSWNFLILRNLFAFLNDIFPLKLFEIIARICKFPALVGCTMTVVIWWLVLVPIIHSLMDKEHRDGFWKFNFSFPLLNFHGMNLPLVILEFILSNTGTYDNSLTYFDLYCGFIVAIFYLIFYLNVLDAAGFHIYVVLSPRPHWSILTYTVIVAIYYGLFNFFNMDVFHNSV